MEEGLDPTAPRRKRVSRACDRCRSKKDKCDGIRPTCTACRASGQRCSYDPNAKKRGLPEGYVRGLEKLFALSICNIEGLEDTILTLLGATSGSTGRRQRLMQLWNEEAASDSLHDVWKTCRLWGALEKMLTPSDPDSSQLSLKRQRDDEDVSHLGASTNWGFSVRSGPNPFGAEGPRVVDPFAPPAAKRLRFSSVSGKYHSSSSGSTDVRSLSLPPQSSQLIETYFSRTHPWFPIIPKHNVLRASYSYAGSHHTESLSSGSGDHAALWAILSYTTAQGSVLSPGSEAIIQDSLAQTKELYSIARSLIPSEKEQFDLGHVQALMLLTLTNIGLEDWTAAWLLSGQTARMIEAIEFSKLSDPRRSDELRQHKAAFLGCFIIDSFLSVRLSRPPCMRTEDLAIVGRLDEDGLEEWNSWTDVLPTTSVGDGKSCRQAGPLLALSCFNRLSEVAGVLNKIARDFYQAPDVQAFTQEILLDLTSWEAKLPPSCRLMEPDSCRLDKQAPLLPHNTYLYLTYAAILLFLFSRQVNQERLQHSVFRATSGSVTQILSRTLVVLSQYAENFHVCGIPPLFEFPLRSIIESVSLIRPTTESEAYPCAEWIRIYSQKLSEIGPSWPVFRSLTSSMEKLLFNSPPQRPFMHQRGTDISSPHESTQQTEYSYAGRRKYSQQPDRKFSTGRYENPAQTRDLLSPTDVFYTTPKEPGTRQTDLFTARSTTQELPMDTTALLDDIIAGRELPNLPTKLLNQPQPETPESTFSNKTSQPVTSSFSTDNFAKASNTHDSATVHFQQQQIHPSDDSSPNDLDAIFKELAYLDTHEWATSREEGLRDFGFMDDTTFQAFCHDPDRLVGSQPLLVPPTSTMIADIWPPPGFFPETFQGDSGKDGGGAG